MQPLFSDAGKQRLSAVVREGLLCAFDFDGTLAPIMPKPGQVTLPEPVRDRLLRLSEHAPVAIITGRALADIRGRLGFSPDFVIGNHGLEGVPGWESRAASHERLCRAWKTQLSHILQQSHLAEGIGIEDKRYSLSVHYRFAPDPPRAEAFLNEACVRLEPPPRIVAGKCIISLMAEDACHKGSALEALIVESRARSALYVGDDVTDEDVFRLKRTDLLSVRVERGAGSAADFFVPGTGEVVYMLDELTKRLRACSARNWLRALQARTEGAGSSI